MVHPSSTTAAAPPPPSPLRNLGASLERWLSHFSALDGSRRRRERLLQRGLEQQRQQLRAGREHAISRQRLDASNGGDGGQGSRGQSGQADGKQPALEMVLAGDDLLLNGRREGLDWQEGGPQAEVATGMGSGAGAGAGAGARTGQEAGAAALLLMTVAPGSATLVTKDLLPLGGWASPKAQATGTQCIGKGKGDTP